MSRPLASFLAAVLFACGLASPALSDAPARNGRAPMTAPPPRIAVARTQRTGPDRSYRMPVLGQTSHAIMMPGGDMPMPANKPSAKPSPVKPPG